LLAALASASCTNVEKSRMNTRMIAIIALILVVIVILFLVL
jgi:hypothetical protein